MESHLKRPGRASLTRYYIQEVVLFLLLMYFSLLGGTLNGLTTFRLNQLTFGLVTLLGLAWFAWRFFCLRTFPATRLDLAWLAMLVAYGIATIFSVDPRRSAMELAQLFAICLAFYLLVDLLRAGWPGNLLIKAILLTSLVPIVLSLLQLAGWYASWIQLAGWSDPLPPTSFRVSALIENPNYSASYFNLLLPLGIVAGLRSCSRLNRLLIGLWAAVALFLVFLTSSRGGWLAMLSVFASLALYLIIEWRQKIKDLWHATRYRPLWIGLAGTLVIIGIAGSLMFFAWQTRSTSSAGTGLQLSARSDIWNVAWQAFLGRPLVGNGPFTYGTQYFKFVSVPTNYPLAHAHNHLLNTAMDAGIFGILSLLLMLVSLGWLAYRRWKSAVGNDRLILGGIFASLVGLAVHSQFDTPVFSPGLGVMIVVMFAWLAAPDIPTLARSWQIASSWALFALFVLLIAGLAYNLLSYLPAIQAVQSAQNEDWAGSAGAYDRAAAIDPSLAFNWFQDGYAHGRLALNPDGSLADRAELDLATAAYQRGFALEPVYAVNWANYAVLAWAGGDHSMAIDAMRRAVKTASNDPAFTLSLGRMLEEQGNVQGAQTAYQAVLNLRPGRAFSYFFRATPLRQQVVEQYLQENPDTVSSPEGPSPSERQLLVATFPSDDGDTYVTARLALGKYYSRQGETQKSIQAYQEAFSAIDRTNSYGIGELGYSPYAWSIFNRESIAPDLLPGIDNILYTDDVVQGMLDLATNFQKTGDTISARDMYQKILDAAPDTQAAQTALSALQLK